jgi:hypothetical protein
VTAISLCNLGAERAKANKDINPYSLLKELNK